MCDYQKDNQHFNGKLIYEYTKEYIDSKEVGLDRINQKLTATIGFSAVLIKFAGDLNILHTKNYILLTTKPIAIVLLLVSIFCSFIALKSKTSGKIVDPKELAEEWWYKSDETTRLFIIRQWFETANELDKVAKTRSTLLNIAFLCIGLSSLCFGINYLMSQS